MSSEEMEQDDIDSYLMSAWIDTIQLYDSSYETDVVVEELVIALYLTRETVNKSIILIRNWLSFDLDQDAIDKVINEA
ncbi:hypothetical protein P3655_22745 [Vibrio parahaemolyticus]|nr:hypothetical protein [Vibrio parahaemolyticus]